MSPQGGSESTGAPIVHIARPRGPVSRSGDSADRGRGHRSRGRVAAERGAYRAVPSGTGGHRLRGSPRTIITGRRGSGVIRACWRRGRRRRRRRRRRRHGRGWGPNSESRAWLGSGCSDRGTWGRIRAGRWSPARLAAW